MRVSPTSPLVQVASAGLWIQHANLKRLYPDVPPFEESTIFAAHRARSKRSLTRAAASLSLTLAVAIGSLAAVAVTTQPHPERSVSLLSERLLAGRATSYTEALTGQAFQIAEPRQGLREPKDDGQPGASAPGSTDGDVPGDIQSDDAPSAEIEPDQITAEDSLAMPGEPERVLPSAQAELPEESTATDLNSQLEPPFSPPAGSGSIATALAPSPAPSGSPQPQPQPTNSVSPSSSAPPPTSVPSASNKPTPANTGVRDAAMLTAIHQDLVIRMPGTIIDSKEIFGSIRVEAANVTIRNSILRGSQTVGKPVVYAASSSVRNLLIEDVEISPTIRNMYTNGVYGHDFTITRANIHDVIDSVHIFNGGNVTIQDSYLHQNLHFGPELDTTHWDGSHDDNIQVQNGSNITIRNNVLSGAYNAAVQITQGRGPVSNVRIADNWIEGGSCSVNIAEGQFGRLFGVAVTNNVFGASRSNCHIILTNRTLNISQIYGNQSTRRGGVVLICHSSSGNVRCG